jgi:hypothetical protein
LFYYLLLPPHERDEPPENPPPLEREDELPERIELECEEELLFVCL